MPPKVKWNTIFRRRHEIRQSNPTAQGIPSSRRKKKDVIVDSLELTVRFLLESSDACPQLKSVVGMINHIITVVETIKGNKAETVCIRERIEHLLKLLSEAVPDATNISPMLLTSVMELHDGLDLVLKHLTPHENKKMLSRLIDKKKDLQRLQSAREQIDVLTGDFKLSNEIHIRVSTDMIPALCAKVDSLHCHVDKQSQVTGRIESDDVMKISIVMTGILFI